MIINKEFNNKMCELYPIFEHKDLDGDYKIYIKHKEWNEFIENITYHRINWFDKNDTYRKKELINLIFQGSKIQLQLISETKEILENYININIPMEKIPKVVAVLDNCVFFIKDWCIEKCLNIIDKVYHKTGSFIIVLPYEFALLIAYYQNNEGIIGKCLNNRFVHCLDIDLLNIDINIIKRRELLEKHLRFLESNKLNWGGIPHWGFKPLDVEVKINWIENVKNKLFKEIYTIIQYCKIENWVDIPKVRGLIE